MLRLERGTRNNCVTMFVIGLSLPLGCQFSGSISRLPNSTSICAKASRAA